MIKWISLVVLTILGQGCKTEKTADELLNNLVSYDHRVPPNGSEGPDSPVEVAISMYIRGLTADDIKQELSMVIFLVQTWKDPRLAYEDETVKTKFLNYEDLARIWKPDLFFSYETQGKFNTIVVPNAVIKWRSDGFLVLSMRLTMSFRCEMDLRYYPHDKQTCQIVIESYAHTRNKVQVTWPSGIHCPVHLNEFVFQDNFQYIGHNCHTRHETLATGNFSRLKVDFSFKRNSGYFVTKLYVPYVVLTIISWLSLWINPRFVALRLSLLSIVFLIMFLLAFELNNYAPHVPYTKGSDVWTAFCISMVFGLYLEFIFLTQMGEKEEAQELSQLGNDAEPLEMDGKGKKYKPLNFHIFQGNTSEGRVIFYRKADFLSRFIFPTLFLIFNVIYWSVYAS